MKSNNKYYAVAKGREIGIFDSWKRVKPLVEGYSGAKYKSFRTLSEAQKYLSATPVDQVSNPLYDDNNNNSNNIIIYTDGSCVDSIGGYGYLIIKGDLITPFSGKVPYHPCTNQIAELYAIYRSLQTTINTYPDYLFGSGVTIYTDSKYSIGCLTEWHYKWNINGWQTSKKTPVKNSDLIKQILARSVGLNINYEHVRAHKGHEYNEWADRLANSGRVDI